MLNWIKFRSTGEVFSISALLNSVTWPFFPEMGEVEIETEVILSESKVVEGVSGPGAPRARAAGD